MHNFDDEVIDEVDDDDEEEDLPPPPPVFTESELEAAKQQAFQDGFNQGKKESEQSREQLLANLMQKLAHDLQMLFIAESEREAVYEREAVALSYAVFKRAFPTLHEKYGLDALKTQMQEILADQHGQNRIEIRIAHEYVSGVEALIAKLRAQNSDLRCDVIGDDGLSEGAFKLNWDNGGASYNSHAIAESILANLEEILAGERVTSHDIKSEESNVSGDQSPSDVADHAIDEVSEVAPIENNNPTAEDGNDDGR